MGIVSFIILLSIHYHISYMEVNFGSRLGSIYGRYFDHCGSAVDHANIDYYGKISSIDGIILGSDKRR